MFTAEALAGRGSWFHSHFDNVMTQLIIVHQEEDRREKIEIAFHFSLSLGLYSGCRIESYF